jgi:hypothetical protein
VSCIQARRTVPSRLSPDSRPRRAGRRRPAHGRRRNDARPDWQTRISESGRHTLRAEGCDTALPLLCCGMAHTFDARPTGPAQAMRDPLLCVRGIPRLEPGARSTLALVRNLTADAFVNVGTHRFASAGVVARHCAATLPWRRAAGVQASGGFSGAEKATPSSRSCFTRNGVCLFGWKPLDARRGRRPKPSERRLQPQADRSLCEG